MNNSELLLALSEMMDKKLNVQLEPITNDITNMKTDISGLKTEVQRTNAILENEISPAIKLLAENYLPAAIRYESSTKEQEEMKADIELLKKVVAEHSEKLQKIS